MLFLGVPTKYAQERGGWATDYTLKQVYQSTFSEQRAKFDTVIDNYFEDIYTDK
jgi:ABC-type transporter MlaC component